MVLTFMSVITTLFIVGILISPPYAPRELLVEERPQVLDEDLDPKFPIQMTLPSGETRTFDRLSDSTEVPAPKVQAQVEDLDRYFDDLARRVTVTEDRLEERVAFLQEELKRSTDRLEELYDRVERRDRQDSHALKLLMAQLFKDGAPSAVETELGALKSRTALKLVGASVRATHNPYTTELAPWDVRDWAINKFGPTGLLWWFQDGGEDLYLPLYEERQEKAWKADPAAALNKVGAEVTDLVIKDVKATVDHQIGLTK